MSPRPSDSVVAFLRSWMNDPIPIEVLLAGAEIMEMDDYTPEKRVHQIVSKCVMLWMEAQAASPAQRKAGSK